MIKNVFLEFNNLNYLQYLIRKVYELREFYYGLI